MPDSHNPELEAAILRDPDDADAYLVYGDWLQQQADPRGELIALMHELEHASEAQIPRLQRRMLWLCHHHLDDLLGAELARRMGRGAANWRAASEGPPRFIMLGKPGPELPVEILLDWRLGFIHTAAVEQDIGRRSPEGSLAEFGAADVVRELLAHPSARFLRGLHVGPTHEYANEYASVIQALVEAGGSRTLETLRLGAINRRRDGHLYDTEVGNVEPLYPLLPRLRTLLLRGTRMELGELRLPELRELSVFHDASPEENGLPHPVVSAIANAVLPQLESLEVWMGAHPEDAAIQLRDIQPLLDGRGVPNLRKLTLHGLRFSDALTTRLLRSDLLPRLRELDLSWGPMPDEAAEVHLLNAPSFQHLERLHLDSIYLAPEVRSRLADMCASISR